MGKTKSTKISKGYRLKPETHEIINTLQEKLRTDADTIISAACRKFLREIEESKIHVKIYRGIEL